jgi:hypothetical protein
MSRARNLADLLDANGDVASGALDNVPPSNDASALTTGTLPVERIADGDITAAKLNSTLDLSGKTVTYGLTSGDMPTGCVLQAKSAGFSSGGASSAVTVSPSGSITLMSITMTVQANSKVMMWFDSHQTGLSDTNVNPNVFFNIDGTNVDSGTNHYFYQNGGRTVIHKIFLSSALTSGSHTFEVIGRSYNGDVTYNYQNNNGGVFMIQEIAG